MTTRAFTPTIRPTVSLLAASLLAVALLPRPLLGEDWNQWRGARRDGVSASPVSMIDALPASGLKPLWVSAEIPSARSGGWSSPIVAGDKVYMYTHERTKLAEGESPQRKFPWLPPEKRVGMSDKEYADYEVKRRDEEENLGRRYRYDELIYCLDAKTGKAIWKNSISGVYTRFPQSASPAVVDGRLYVLASGRQARCVNAETGKDIWTVRLPGEFRDEFIQSSFAVTGGVAVVMANRLFGLDAASGKIRWKTEECPATHTSPIIWERDDKPYVIANVGNNETICVEAATGETVWHVETGAGRSTPVVVGNRLITYGSSRKKGLCCFDLSTNPPERLWRYQGAGDSGASPVVVGDQVYVQGERRMACVSLATGKPAWMKLLDMGNPRYTSLAAADGKVFYTFESIFVFAADPGKFRELMDGHIDKQGMLASEAAFRKMLKLDELEKTPEGQKQSDRLWRQTMGDGPLACASPAIVDGKLFVRLKNSVACYDMKVAAD